MEILTPLSLLMPAFSLEQSPQPLPRLLRSLLDAPLPIPSPGHPRAPGLVTESRSFGDVLKPRYIFRAGSLDQ